jgi:hypothetical protein
VLMMSVRDATMSNDRIFMDAGSRAVDDADR